MAEHLLPLMHDHIKIEAIAQKLSERGATSLEDAISMLQKIEPEARRANQRLTFLDALYEFLRRG